MNKDNTTLIVAVIAGTIITGTLAYLFLTEQGKNLIRDRASEMVAKKSGVPKKIVKKAAKHVG